MSKQKEKKEKELQKENVTSSEEETINEDNNQIQELENKIKQLEDDVLKAKADMINYRKRKDEEVSRLLKYSAEDILSDFLPILDNFERAIELDDDNLDDELSKFLEGFKMIYASARNLVEKYDVKEIEALGRKFDADYHQAVLTDKVDDKESGIILDVMQKGYIYKDKVIRPSMVKVNE